MNEKKLKYFFILLFSGNAISNFRSKYHKDTYYPEIMLLHYPRDERIKMMLIKCNSPGRNRDMTRI